MAALAPIVIWQMPAAAQQPLSPSEMALPEEQSIATELTLMMTQHNEDYSNVLRRLDTLLARLNRPTRLRGLIQFGRATVFDATDQPDNARNAVEESIRLLPGYALPLVLAFQIEVYADRPAQAADYLLRAVEIDPQLMRNIPDHEVGNLVGRLGQRGEQRRLERVADRLFAIGWLGERPDLRSRLARELIEGRLKSGDIDSARRLLPSLLVPADAQQLLTQHRYQTFWPDIELWAGPRQANLWRTYLADAAQRWRASRSPEHAAAYARALEAAGHHETMVREFLPPFHRQLEQRDDYELLWLATHLGSALARLNRWDEADQVFANGLAIWPLGSDANALNLAANRARLQLARGNAAAALAGIEAAISDSRRWHGQVSIGALGSMHWVRACALTELKREVEAVASLPTVLAGGSMIDKAATYLCLGRRESARDVLIAALEDEQLRGEVILFVQPRAIPAMQSGYSRRVEAELSALRSDPMLLQAVERYGRVLPYARSAGAPPEDSAPD